MRKVSFLLITKRHDNHFSKLYYKKWLRITFLQIKKIENKQSITFYRRNSKAFHAFELFQSDFLNKQGLMLSHWTTNQIQYWTLDVTILLLFLKYVTRGTSTQPLSKNEPYQIIVSIYPKSSDKHARGRITVAWT